MEPPDPGTSKAASIATAAASVKAVGGAPHGMSKAASLVGLSDPVGHIPRVVPVPGAPLGVAPLGAPPLGALPVKAPPPSMPPPAFSPGGFISGPGPDVSVKAAPGQFLDGIPAKMPPPQFEVVPGGVIGMKMPPVGPPSLAPPMMSTSLPDLPAFMGLAPPVGPPPAILRPPELPPPAGLLAAVDAAVERAGAPPSGPVEKVEWQAHQTGEGLPYYFCKKTGESRWVRPCGPGDVIVDPKKEEPKDTSVKGKLGEPESWESIGKTGWTRVQTDKGYTYFYHKKQKKTSWTCPPEIAKEVAELDGSLGAVEGEAESKEEKGDEEGKEGAEGTGDAQGEPAGGEEDGAKKQTKAEKAEKRAQQVEEEQKAAKEKDKLRNFKQLLVEKGVRAFDKYEKWVPKLMHDPRFTAVTGLKERRLLFEMLAKRIETEKRKTQAVCKNRGREAFKELLDKAEKLDLLAGRTVEKALASMERRFGDEAQWDAVPERDRERMVAEAVAETTKRAEKQKEGARANFRTLVLDILKGQEEDPPPFSKARRRLETDPSWTQLASTERENLYNRLARELKDAKRKQTAKRREVQQD